MYLCTDSLEQAQGISAHWLGLPPEDAVELGTFPAAEAKVGQLGSKLHIPHEEMQHGDLVEKKKTSIIAKPRIRLSMP